MFAIGDHVRVIKSNVIGYLSEGPDIGHEGVIIGLPFENGNDAYYTVDFGRRYLFTHDAGQRFGTDPHYRNYEGNYLELICESDMIEDEITEEEFYKCLNAT